MLSEPGPDRKIQTAERRRRSDIFDRGTRDRQNHHASEHHAGERGCEAEHEKLAADEFHDGDEDRSRATERVPRPKSCASPPGAQAQKVCRAPRERTASQPPAVREESRAIPRCAAHLQVSGSMTRLETKLMG
jgi:hypothetical protein